MSLLFDENLSVALVRDVAEAFPGSTHVETIASRGRTDAELWGVAVRERLAIVSKDGDFRQLSFVRGHPPKVIWLAVGNAGTRAISRLLLECIDRIRAFLASSEESLLVLRSPPESATEAE